MPLIAGSRFHPQDEVRALPRSQSTGKGGYFYPKFTLCAKNAMYMNGEIKNTNVWNPIGFIFVGYRKINICSDADQIVISRLNSHSY